MKIDVKIIIIKIYLSTYLVPGVKLTQFHL